MHHLTALYGDSWINGQAIFNLDIFSSFPALHERSKCTLTYLVDCVRRVVCGFVKQWLFVVWPLVGDTSPRS